MPQIDETLLRGFRILYKEWGAGYSRTSPWPLLPTEDMGAFLDPPPHQVLKRLSQEIGTVSTKRLFHHVLSLNSKEEQLKLVESLGFPETQCRFFYLEAAYTLVPLCWKDIQKEDEVIELLVYNLFAYNYLSNECVPYLLLLLQISLDQLFPLLEKLLDDKNWLIPYFCANRRHFYSLMQTQAISNRF